MADELDQDSQVLLDGLGLGAPPADHQPDDEIVVPARTDDDAGGLGGSGSSAPPPSEYVPKAEYEALRQQVEAQRAQFDAIQQQLGQRAAQQFQPQYQQPQYVPPSQYGQPVSQAELQQQLNDAILANPSAVIPQLVQMAIQRQGQPLVAAQQQTEVTVAQQVISNLRNSFASQDPELSKLAFPVVDKLVAETDPARLAAMLRDGSLQTHYTNAYHQAVGEKMRPVYQTAAQRRTQQRAVNEPPNISGGSVTSIAGKRGTGEVRMSDLDEATREAIKEGAKYGVSAETILAMDA